MAKIKRLAAPRAAALGALHPSIACLRAMGMTSTKPHPARAHALQHSPQLSSTGWQLSTRGRTTDMFKSHSMASHNLRQAARFLGPACRASCATSRPVRAPPLHTTLRLSSTAARIKRVKQDRLLDEIHSTAQWGTGQRWGEHATETGMSRLALSDSDKQVRDWFASTTSALGCTVTVDEMGNQFAVRAGKKEGAPTFVGSHLDTQPTGGRYDGVLGVHAGIEMLRTLEENDIATNYPVGVVNWTNEEGARFPISMVSSGVWAGSIPLETAHNLASVIPRGDSSATMKSELERIGYLGSVPCSHESTPMAAHFELHIEQGPRLENQKRKIGIVTGVQAYRWFTITVKGRDCHTGTTDLSSRSDALLAAAKMIVAAREAAHSQGGLASTGIIEAQPGSTNTVPGLVKFSLDLRAQEDKTVDALERQLREEFAWIASGKDAITYRTKTTPRDRVQVAWRKDSDSPAVQFSDECITCVTEACEELFGNDVDARILQLASGAGHDSVYTSRRVPTSMIFVPSRDGVSHNPVEYTSPEDCATGTQILMGAVLKFDGKRTE